MRSYFVLFQRSDPKREQSNRHRENRSQIIVTQGIPEESGLHYLQRRLATTALIKFHHDHFSRALQQ
jgi:hypothetical protein